MQIQVFFLSDSGDERRVPVIHRNGIPRTRSAAARAPIERTGVERSGVPTDDNLFSVRVLDCGVVLVHKVILYELDGQRRLADTSCAHYNQLVFRHSCSGLMFIIVAGASLNSNRLLLGSHCSVFNWLQSQYRAGLCLGPGTGNTRDWASQRQRKEMFLFIEVSPPSPPPLYGRCCLESLFTATHKNSCFQTMDGRVQITSSTKIRPRVSWLAR